MKHNIGDTLPTSRVYSTLQDTECSENPRLKTSWYHVYRIIEFAVRIQL